MATISPERSLTSSSLEEKREIEPTVAAFTKRVWYRSVFFNVTVVGGAAFLSPGIWEAMNSLGAVGGQDAWLVNAANSLVFGLMVVTCLFGSSIVDRIGYRWALSLGTGGYSLYASGLVYNLNTGATWLIFVGSMTCSLSAGLFWATEGAIVLGYPEPGKRGRYLSYWLGWRNAGQILGGIISLSLNAKANKAGHISESTYYTFIALQAVAPFVAFFLSTPSKVQRPDRTEVRMEQHVGFKAEMSQLFALLKRREVLYFVVISLVAQWPNSYASTFLSVYFSVRARSLASLTTAILGVVVNTILGLFLDSNFSSKEVRVRSAYIFIMSLFGGVWIWFTILQLRYIDHKPKLDWVDGPAFAAPFALYLVYQICRFLIQNFLYYIISELAREPNELIRLSSFLRGLESAGSACGFGVSARKSLPYTVPLSLNFGLWGLATITAWFTVRDVGVRINAFDKAVRQ